MRKYALMLSLFLFLILFSSQAYASLPIDTFIDNYLFPQLNCANDIDCINASGTIRCAINCPSRILIFNETYGFEKTVDTSPYSNMQSIVWKNYTHIYVKYGYVIHLWNVEAETAGLVVDDAPGNLLGGDYYEKEDWLYYPSELNKVINHTGTATYKTKTIFNGFWGSNIVDLTIPNASDNSTIYVSDPYNENYLNKYVNGANVSRTSHYWLFGVNNYSGVVRGFSAIKIDDSTTWLYFHAGTEDSYKWDLYRVNLSLTEEYDFVEITPVYPNNNTIKKEPFSFKVDLITDLNGTIMWYLYNEDTGIDQWGNTTISDAPTSRQVSIQHSELDEGNYYWFAIYLDSNALQTSTWVTYFTIEDRTLIPMLKDVLSNIFGTDLEDSGLLFALLISILLAVGVTIKLGRSVDSTTTFVVVLITSFFVCWAIGLVPDFFILLISFFLVTMVIYKFKGG